MCPATGLDIMCEVNIANHKLKYFESVKVNQLRKLTLFKSNIPYNKLDTLKKMNCGKWFIEHME